MAHSPSPESRFVWVDVFAAWVTTEWLKISKGEELIRKGRFGDAFVPQSFARATPHVEEESAKIKHERENDASVRDAESRSIEVAQNLSFRQLGARLRMVIDGFVTENPQVLKVVDSTGTESVEGFCVEDVRNLRYCSLVYGFPRGVVMGGNGCDGIIRDV